MEKHETWLNHPYTVKARKAFEKKRDEAELAFIKACKESTDPAVRAAFERHAQLEIITTFFGGENVED